MNKPITRRTALKLIATATVVGASAGPNTGAAAANRGHDAESVETWSRTHDRVWLGGACWANPVKKTYALDSFRFLIDATDGKASNQFPEWPVTIHQEENRGRNRLR
jgi:alkaline phosphatase D